MQEKENKEKNELDPKRVGEHRPGREKNNPFQRGRLPAPRSSRAAVVWLVLLLAIGSLVLFRGFGPSKVVTLSESEFERLLRESKVASAVISTWKANSAAVLPVRRARSSKTRRRKAPGGGAGIFPG